MVLTARNESQLNVAKIDGHRVGIELIVRLPDKVKPGTRPSAGQRPPGHPNS
jgi:hypothetical protein